MNLRSSNSIPHADVGMPGRVESVVRWFSGRQFGLASLSLIAALLLLVGALLAIPESAGKAGSFAADFRKWCFGTDSAGETNTVRVVLFFLDPLVLGVIISVLWKKQMKEARMKEILFYSIFSLALVIGLSAYFAWGSEKEIAFPAEQLRMSQAAPEFSLVDQSGTQVSLASCKGRIVLMTAFFTTCHNTCPLIMNQIKRSLARLPASQSQALTVLAVSMDPERDTVDKLNSYARTTDLKTPQYHLLTGESRQIHSLLEKLSIGRVKNPQTGNIEHANIILLVDRFGKIAYRFTLGETQEKWMGQAIELLLKEETTMNP